MDPNEALSKIHALQADFELGDSDPNVLVGIAEELIETFEALDNWIATGGFLPRDWSK